MAGNNELNLHGLTAAMILAGVAVLPHPAIAQWDVRPAPPSWGGPAGAPAATTASPAGTTNRPVMLATPASAGYLAALRCAATLQVAALAAPSWSREPGVLEATNNWLERAFALAPSAGVAGDQVSGQVRSEMDRQTQAAASDPSNLSRRAFDCAAGGQS